MVDKDKIKCDLCGKSFYSRKQLEQHEQDAHRTVNENIKIKPHKGSFKPSIKLITIIAAGVLVAIIGGIGIIYTNALHSPLVQTVDGIECNAFEQLLFHIHAHLDIIINGQYFLVPAQIGIIPDKCFYWMHTHDVTGIIHIESPINRDFTLGQFFDIWNKKLNNDQIKFNNNQIFNYMANGNNPLSVFINGSKVLNGTNYRDIKLHAHDEIAIAYGRHTSSIPSSYSFPEGL